MGRTIPSFRIAAIREEKEWKTFRKDLNKKDRKVFDDMFSIAKLYNSACSYSIIPIKIYPILISIVLHHYKIIKDLAGFDTSYFSTEQDISHNSIILKQELDKWNSFSSTLRKQNRILFNQMLKSAYKYSGAIEAKGENYATQSLIMSILLEHHKKIMKDIN